MTDLVLLIEDDALLGNAMERTLKLAGRQVERVRSLAEARRADPARFTAVLLDIGLPDGSGTDLLTEWKLARPELPIIVVTGDMSFDTALSALRGRAFDYLLKPVSPDALCAVLARALETAQLRREVVNLREQFARRENQSDLLGSSQAAIRLNQRIHMVAPAPSTVLILGETGTGKELVARSIHKSSGRAGRFVAVNCSALPENLLEAELFGHRKGAFTGAVHDRRGLVAEANGGTLFLDEIGDMPPLLQAKLLRLLQNREYRMLGDDEERTADIRVIAATNRDLKSDMAAGRFREDLFWRLAVVTLEIPPLRERIEDLDALASHFIARHAVLFGKVVKGLAPAALAKLRAHRWPGNVRELENVLERAVLLGAGDIVEEGDIEFQMPGPDPAATASPLVPDDPGAGFDEELTKELGAVTRAKLIRLLEENRYQVSHAARAAGRNRTSFYVLLKKHGIDLVDLRARKND
ncbi:MAG: sigma-54 dependent transcriptional regulator [Candidatus Hydrogenedentota bacterium]